MVPPRFSAWSTFILRGLGGWRSGDSEQPPGFEPPSAIGDGAGGPPLTPPFPPTAGSSSARPPFPVGDGPPSGPSMPESLYMQDTPSNGTTNTPIATADAAQRGNYSMYPVGGNSSAECMLFDSPLTNLEQVGDSTWGTLCQPPVRQWLDKPDGTKYPTAPWGNHTTRNTDPTLPSHIPITNVTRTYDWTIRRSRISPDGVLRDVILVNAQYPGPMIEANFGDWIEVRVHNAITAPEEGTAIHWHGLPQRETPWMDGTPGVAQCPIAPGESFTYRFRAEVYGTSFWHAHYSAQYTAGVVGPIVIHGPSVRGYDVDIGPVTLNEWNHIPYFSMVANVVGTDFSKLPPLSDSGLINGHGRFDCSIPSYSNSSDWLGSYFESDLKWTCVEGAQRAKFRFQSGKTHRLRLINQGGDGVQKFSIDKHTMTVIATDFVPIQPYETDVVTLGVGQRTDVLVTANPDPKTSVWMRTQLPGGPECGGLGPWGAPIPPLGASMPPDTIYPDVLAAIYWEDADPSVDPTTTTTLEPRDCTNDDLALTRPDYPTPPKPSPYILSLTMTLALNSTGNFEWRTNDQTYRADYNHPLLYDIAANPENTTFPENPEWNIYDLGANESVVLNVTNLTPFTHPMHLHGHVFQILTEGPAGTIWSPPPTTNNTSPTNPSRRDTHILPSGGWAALQFDLDNPGVWHFHCHAAWHLASGLAVTFVARAGEIVGIPGGAREASCKGWERWTGGRGRGVDQVDSGS